MKRDELIELLRTLKDDEELIINQEEIQIVKKEDTGNGN